MRPRAQELRDAIASAARHPACITRFGLANAMLRLFSATGGGETGKKLLGLAGSMAGLFGSTAYAGQFNFRITSGTIAAEPASLLLMIAVAGVLFLLRRDDTA